MTAADRIGPRVDRVVTYFRASRVSLGQLFRARPGLVFSASAPEGRRDASYLLADFRE